MNIIMLALLYKIQSSVEVPVGHSTIRFEFKREMILQGTGKLYIDGQLVGTLYMPRTLPFVISVEGLDIGRDRLTAVSPNYPLPEFPFGGRIEKAVIELHDDYEYSKFFKKEKRDPIYINIDGSISYL